MHPDHKKPYIQGYLSAYGARKVEANTLIVRIGAGSHLMLEAICKYLAHDSTGTFEVARVEHAKELRGSIKAMLKDS